MLQNFFKLNDEQAARQLQADDLKLHFQNAGSLENADLLGETIGSGNPRDWKPVFTDHTFKNVRFSHATFERITFTRCKFIDCLFIGATFDSCEFHRSKIVNCNTNKFTLKDVYLDPAYVVLDRKYKKKAANVGVDLFHELYRNAVESRQDSFARYADIRMERWKRAQLRYDRKQGKINWLQFCWLWVKNFFSDIFLGYGYGWINFLVAGVGLFGLLAFILHQTWEMLELKISSGATAAPSYLDMLYYSMLLITTLGFAEAMPSSTYGRLVAVAFALGGIVWAGILTSLLVRRLIK